MKQNMLLEAMFGVVGTCVEAGAVRCLVQPLS